MSLDLSDILPNLAYSLEETGFLFGAGTSVEAGYPMMNGLTRQVVASLTADERATLDRALAAAGQTYSDASATPNIEEMADRVIAHAITAGDPRSTALESKLRESVVQVLLSVGAPVLDHHVQFLRRLSQRTFGRPGAVWIFTTNYDLLFETAAAKAGVLVENGFSGTTERFFNPTQFHTMTGSLEGGRFRPNNQLTIRLVKLHGSLSWFTEGGQIFERHPAAITGTTSRVMVLPRRKKVLDTLAHPHDALFSQASRILGSGCKYLVSCGFSFGDEHINDHLLLPALGAGRVRLFALSEYEPDGIAAFKTLPSFSAGFSDGLISGGRPSTPGTTRWKFSDFVTLF